MEAQEGESTIVSEKITHYEVLEEIGEGDMNKQNWGWVLLVGMAKELFSCSDTWRRDFHTGAFRCWQQCRGTRDPFELAAQDWSISDGGADFRCESAGQPQNA